MVDASMTHTTHSFQHFDARVAKVFARACRPEMIDERLDLRCGDRAKEATGGVSRCLFFFHVSLPSFPLLTFYSVTWPAWDSGRPWRWAARYGAAVCRSRSPARRLS